MPQIGFDRATDARVWQVVTTAVDELGGLCEWMQRRELGILPAVIEAGYVLVLKEEQHRSETEIAAALGISSGTVASVFAAPTTDEPARLGQAQSDAEQCDPERSADPLTTHLEPGQLAGAIAKFAYSVLQRRERERGQP